MVAGAKAPRSWSMLHSSDFISLIPCVIQPAWLFSMIPVFEDSRLEAIRAKVAAGERLSYQDGLVIYRTPDLLGVGWLANQVRERLHGNKTYFNVNRHLNPTDVC